MSAFQVGDRPTPDMGVFDIIILNEMIYYVEDVDGLLDHLEGYLADDGWIVSSMFQHPGDVALRRTLAARFTEFESLTISRESPRKAWRLACYARKPAAMPRPRHAWRIIHSNRPWPGGPAGEASRLQFI